MASFPGANFLGALLREVRAGNRVARNKVRCCYLRTRFALFRHSLNNLVSNRLPLRAAYRASFGSFFRCHLVPFAFSCSENGVLRRNSMTSSSW